MSRSFKKPWIKGNSPEFKKICSRAHRRVGRQILKGWRYKWVETHSGCEYEPVMASWLPWDDKFYEENFCGFYCNCAQFTAPMEPHFPTRRELVDQYTICDWKYFNPDEPKNFRK